MKTLAVVLLLALGAGILVLMIIKRSVSPTSQVVQVATARSLIVPQPRVTSELSLLSPTELATAAAEKRDLISTELQASRGKIFNEPTVDVEKRDDVWADLSEIAIRRSLENIPNINMGTISVICGSSVCRATGSLKDTGSSLENDQSVKAIINETFFVPDTSSNVMPKRSVANSGSGNGFLIEFSRLHK